MTEAEDRFQQLRRRFIDRSAGDLDVLRSQSDREELRMIVHRLAGAAGTFGYAEISADAGLVDDALVEGRDPEPEIMDRLIASIEALIETRDV
jgi:HPt (histidine-containing phosphotransfer) domain-containing protein